MQQVLSFVFGVEFGNRNDPVLKKQYENFRSKYWRWRAKHIDKGEGTCAEDYSEG
ncbi:MAG: HNH/ENDO VII family nuclease [Rummeliibacillus sp.]